MTNPNEPSFPGNGPQQPGSGGPQEPMSKQEARARAAADKAYRNGQQNWFARHKILTAIGAVVVLGIVATALGGGWERQGHHRRRRAVFRHRFHRYPRCR